MESWLVFIPQLPSSPSSLRVLVWRRMRGVGATTLQQGVWVLPHAPPHEQFVREVVADVRQQGGDAILLTATLLDPAEEVGIIARFRTDRDQEYREFDGQCQDFLAEIVKETQAENFTFAELEENEQDLQKLVGWLRKIQARDFVGSEQAAVAIAALDHCKQVMEAFARAIYQHEGIEEPPSEP